MYLINVSENSECSKNVPTSGLFPWNWGWILHGKQGYHQVNAHKNPRVQVKFYANITTTYLLYLEQDFLTHMRTLAW